MAPQATEEALRARLRGCHERLTALREAVGRVVVGYDDAVEQVLACLMAGGHALLEGAPGLGKTLLVRTLSSALDLSFSRIQFTPDLMPSDITGTHLVVEGPDGRKQFEFRRGPVFANLLLADEVNRATPKTQSALLEAMAEGAVTAGGERHALPVPFFVLATQNPIEMEGTYPLPEAQLDRFLFKILLGSPAPEAIVEILERTTGAAGSTPVPVAHAAQVEELREAARGVVAPRGLLAYAARLVAAGHPDGPGAPPGVRRWVRYGPSPRAAQGLILGAKARALLDGRPYADPNGLRWAAAPVLRHRILLNFEAQAEGITPERVVEELLRSVPQDGPEVERLLRKT